MHGDFSFPPSSSEIQQKETLNTVWKNFMMEKYYCRYPSPISGISPPWPAERTACHNARDSLSFLFRFDRVYLSKSFQLLIRKPFEAGFGILLREPILCQRCPALFVWLRQRRFVCVRYSCSVCNSRANCKSCSRVVCQQWTKIIPFHCEERCPVPTITFTLIIPRFVGFTVSVRR